MSYNASLSAFCSKLNIDACILLGTDIHSLEYTIHPFRFRHVLSSFNGSAGTLLCTITGENILYSDGRYEQALKRQCIDYHISFEKDWEHQIQWLSQHPEVSRVGVCTYHIDATNYDSLQRLVKKAKFTLHPLSLQSVIDASIETSKHYARYYRSIKQHTETRSSRCITLPMQYVCNKTNTLVRNKMVSKMGGPLLCMQAFLEAQGLLAYFTTQIQEIAYLLGLRGYMTHLMLFPAIMLLDINTQRTKRQHSSHTTSNMFNIVLWLTKEMRQDTILKKIHQQIKTQLQSSPSLVIKNYEDALVDFPSQVDLVFSHIPSVAVDPAIVPSVIWHNTHTATAYKKRIKKIQSPIKRWRSVYSQTQLKSMRKAFRLDTIALLESIAEIYSNIQEGIRITEAQVDGYLLKHKKRYPQFIQNSFSTIAAVGKNAAVPHYDPQKSRKRLSLTEPLLIDCGSHYIGNALGTTDITRVFYFGEEPPALLVEDYTLVLKAHIKLLFSLFPAHATGTDIDTILRVPLLEQGRTFNHGIGHGIGYCSDVHDGYFFISSKGTREPFIDSLVLSNEPGYYRIGKWGIRLENIVLSHIHSDILRFDALSFFPFQESLIERTLLSEEEKQYLDVYQKTCHKQFMHVLSPKAKRFLDLQLTGQLGNN